LRLAHDLARDITARHDLVDVLAATLTSLRRWITFTGGSIQLLDDDGWIRLAAADPAPSPEVLALRIPLSSSVGGRVILTERPIYIPDVLAEADLVGPPSDEVTQAPLAARISPGGVRSYFGVPLLADGHAIGLLQVDSTELDPWNESDRLLLASVAPIVAAAIQNARAHGRVAVLTAVRRRDAERHALMQRIIDADVDSTLAALVALSEDNPLVRDQVDVLTGAIARLRAALGEGALPVDNLDGDDQPRAAASSGRIDLRSGDPTRR
jgi:GAF domain-containing protein